MPEGELAYDDDKSDEVMEENESDSVNSDDN